VIYIFSFFPWHSFDVERIVTLERLPVLFFLLVSDSSIVICSTQSLDKVSRPPFLCISSWRIHIDSVLFVSRLLVILYICWFLSVLSHVMIHRDFGLEVHIRLGIHVVPVCYSYFTTWKSHWQDSSDASYLSWVPGTGFLSWVLYFPNSSMKS